MLVHRRFTPSIVFARTHLYTWVERDTLRIKCLTQKPNTVPLARARTRTAAKTMRNVRCLLRAISDLTYCTLETCYSSSELKTANVLLTGDRKQKAEYTFLLRTRKGIKYIFRAASEEDRMDWVQTLQTVCENT